MRSIFVALALSILAAQAGFAADEDIRWWRTTWNGPNGQAFQDALPEGITVIEDRTAVKEGRVCLKITYTGQTPASVILFTKDNPQARQGMIVYDAFLRTQDVKEKAYLEILTRFKGKEYFGRGLDAPVSGTEDWKRAQTSFFFSAEQQPERLSFGVRFEGPGTVWLDAARIQPAMFWKQPIKFRLTGKAWGLIGGVMGILCGLWGALGGILAPRGRGRLLMFFSGVFLCLVFLAALVFGLLLILNAEDRIYWQPWLLCGGIGLVVMLPLMPVMHYRYQQAELRKMTAQDL